jgi:ABC-type glutathione transport system ATPase component
MSRPSRVNRFPTSAVIDVKDLHKDFGRVHALNGLDLRVCEGEIHGFLGPNGSGKTTTIRILLGIQHVPGEPFRAAPVVWLLLIDAALRAVGLAAFRRRDLR